MKGVINMLGNGLETNWLATAMVVVMFSLNLSIAGRACAAESEGQLIETLRGDGDWATKFEACRRLGEIGSERSIEPLAALLRDEKLTEVARSALEVMPYEAVDTVFRRALKTTDGEARLGVINSIGVRRDEQAIDALTALLNESDEATALAAGRALADIGTPRAAERIVGWREEADEAMSAAAAEISLVAADRLRERGEVERAAAMYHELRSPRWPESVRMGAFRGLMFVEPERAADRLINALGRGDDKMRGYAAFLVTRLPASNAEAIATLSEAAASLHPAGRIALLGALAERDEPVARQAALDALRSTHEGIQLAAIDAMGSLGGASDVSVLMSLVGSDSSETAQAVENALVAMRGEAVDQAIARSTTQASPAARVTAVGALTRRGATGQADTIERLTHDDDAAVRVAALGAMAGLARCDQVTSVIDVMVVSNDREEHAAAEKSLRAICARCGDEVLGPVVAAMRQAPSTERVALLRALLSIGTPSALAAVRERLGDDSDAVRGEAVRVLADWPTVEAAGDLLREAKQGPTAVHRILSLRGYVRLAGIEQSLDQRAAMLREAEALADRPEEMRLVLSTWSSIANETALKAAVAKLGDPAVRDEAALAAVRIAERLDKSHRAAVKDAMGRVLRACEDEKIRQHAEKVMAEASGS